MTASDLQASPSFLLSQVGAHLARLFAEDLERAGLTPRQYAVLHRASQPGEHRQQDLADGLGMHRNNMTTLIDAMAHDGLVRREPHPTDARCFHITVTARGAEALRRGDEVRRHLDRTIGRALGQAEPQLAPVLQQLGREFGLPPGVHPHLAATYPGRRTRRRAT